MQECTKQLLCDNLLGIPVFVGEGGFVRKSNHVLIPAKTCSSRMAVSDTDMAMLLPCEALSITIHLDESGTSYMYTDMCPEYVFKAKPAWQCVHRVFGANSTIHALAYVDATDNVVLGIFDISCHNGVQLTGPLIDRHILVFKLMHSSALALNLRYHWMGFKDTCYHELQRSNLPFRCHKLMVLCSNGQHYKVLAPLSL